ncbi:RidA family protein [Ruicaihuangia caeni]|uniref:Rid family detoxifying hydrolase n=1 Tax=Ruicaihuangia caeni TaxID=3042517 RepID=A0AAW6T6R9_9MICO|nr:Rid family detoxifying hydrolase [Klugiella sp. YN-L-19]MDI2099194.1 Rid family detoxifying hydrolase [Klugiella sp. YN-L-19]
MERTIVAPAKAPALSPQYSAAVIAGDTVYFAGQVGIDPATRELASGIEAQTRQALTNLTAVLEEAGSSRDQVVKTLCFLNDLADFDGFNKVYAEFFPDAPPARSTVGVALPDGMLVEIEGIAIKGA